MQRTSCNRAGSKATSLLQLALVGLLTTTNLLAQQAVGSPRLVQTGRAFARSEGRVTHCLFTADASRALTIGSERDLVWWDLRERRPLRHVEPLGTPFVDVLLHPDEPWLVCLAADGTGVKIDLESDERTVLTETQVGNLAPSADRAWLGGGNPMARAHLVSPTVASANGEFRLARTRIGWEREPSNAQFFNSGDVWIANDGTIVNARGPVLEFFGLRHTDRTTASVHASPPHRLVFTPDGNHLALVSSVQTAVVDLLGTEVTRLPGPLLPIPGPGPDEFWLLADAGMQRWSCTLRGYVGERVTWPGHSIHETPLFGQARLADDPMIVHNGQPWTPHYARLPDASWRRLKRRQLTAEERNNLDHGSAEKSIFGEPAMDFTVAGAKPAPILLTSFGELDEAPNSGIDQMKFPPRSTLRRFSDDGETTHQVVFRGVSARWLAVTGTRVLVGLGADSMATFDGESLEELSRVALPRPIVDAVATGDDLIAIRGTSLVWMQATNVAKQTDLPLPEGLSGVDQIAISADGRRLAVACRSEVRILTIEK